MSKRGAIFVHDVGRISHISSSTWIRTNGEKCQISHSRVSWALAQISCLRFCAFLAESQVWFLWDSFIESVLGLRVIHLLFSIRVKTPSFTLTDRHTAKTLITGCWTWTPVLGTWPGVKCISIHVPVCPLFVQHKTGYVLLDFGELADASCKDYLRVRFAP